MTTNSESNSRLLQEQRVLEAKCKGLKFQCSKARSLLTKFRWASGSPLVLRRCSCTAFVCTTKTLAMHVAASDNCAHALCAGRALTRA
jgi:hypothetical protein